jgi:hypothetical protein
LIWISFGESPCTNEIDGGHYEKHSDRNKLTKAIWRDRPYYWHGGNPERTYDIGCITHYAGPGSYAFQSFAP